MKIKFSLPLLDQDVLDEVHHTLVDVGWLCAGPQTRALEQEIAKLTGSEAVLCVSSWTSGAMLALRWFGVGPGDEVIVPAYTYCATALAVMNLGATPVMVDVREDFTIDPDKIREAITCRTKAIIPVDLGGLPCDYQAITQIVTDGRVRAMFSPCGEIQTKLGRILVVADAAHSIGATYRSDQVGKVADVTVFSFHSAKNITTGEGGAICLDLPAPLSNDEECRFLRALSLNGQTVGAMEKNQPGNWRYDIIAQGFKANMSDLCAAVGLAQIRKYQKELLPERKRIADFYSQRLGQYEWALLPPFVDHERVSSYHLYLLRIRDFSEIQRNRMIQLISEEGIGVNVHYIPMPMLTLFRSNGYRIGDYPMAYQLYQNEITLPVYNGLTQEQLASVVAGVVKAYTIVQQEQCVASAAKRAG
jgi:dTDP-4-amino-4,6-dideoxygalactose transaminase